MAISTGRDVHKKYTVSTASGTRFAKTDTLAEAKRAGTAIARKQAGKGKFNVPYLTLSITKQRSPGSIFFDRTGWEMYIPVRGSGQTGSEIINTIRRREGSKALTWVRKAR